MTAAGTRHKSQHRRRNSENQGDKTDRPRKHLLDKGVGIAAITELGRDVIQECLASNDTSIEAYAEFLGNLDGLDWGNRTSPFSLIGGQKGATAAAKALKGIVFGDFEV